MDGLRRLYDDDLDEEINTLRARAYAQGHAEGYVAGAMDAASDDLRWEDVAEFYRERAERLVDTVDRVQVVFEQALQALKGAE